jgi:CheY-like chemotaxis protein
MSDGQIFSRVLVVDDERLIADSLTLILQQRGFHAVAAYSGEDAITAAAAHKPDVVITDIIMGAMNGIEAAHLISKMLPDCRILLFSGQPAVADLLLQANDCGYGFEVLPKPIHPDVILQRISGARSKNLLRS